MQKPRTTPVPPPNFGRGGSPSRARCNGEHARDQRLRGDDGRERGEDTYGTSVPTSVAKRRPRRGHRRQSSARHAGSGQPGSEQPGSEQPCPHDQLRTFPRPSFATVCLELVRVTGRFLREREREQAYPPPPSGRRHRWKSSQVQAFTGQSDPPVLGRSRQTCTEAGSLPVENVVISTKLQGFGARA